jgi:hypothetical protein
MIVFRGERGRLRGVEECEGRLQGHYSSAQEGQPIVESSPRVVEALMCHRQPLDLVAQHGLSALAKHPYVHLI